MGQLSVSSNLKQWTYPVPAGEPATEVTIAEDAFAAVFAADVPAEVTRILAVAQRPLAAAAFEETATAATRRTKPDRALVAGADNATNPEVERFGAKRADATIVEIEGASHITVAVSRPKEVAELIRTAFRAAGCHPRSSRADTSEQSRADTSEQSRGRVPRITSARPPAFSPSGSRLRPACAAPGPSPLPAMRAGRRRSPLRAGGRGRHGGS